MGVPPVGSFLLTVVGSQIEFLDFTRKAERMLVDEVQSINAPTNMRRLDGLQCRRDACKELNMKFGLDVDVVWFEDFITPNFNTMENIEKLNKVIENGN